MKKLIITNLIIGALLWFNMTTFAKSAKASEYNTAVIAHVITQKVSGQSIDTSKLMEQELTRLAHLYAIDMISVFQKYLPSLLDGVTAELRLHADKNYKCKLIKDTKIQDNCS